MALPALLKKLFANEGAENKLKKEIIPDLSPEYITNYENGTVTSSSAEKGIGFGQKGDGEFAVIMNGNHEEFGISLYQDYGGGTLYDREMLKWHLDGLHGYFVLNAIEPMGIDDIKHYQTTSLKGTVGGKLTWAEKPVITLVDSWKDGENWYRKYSDGWIEQGGYSSTWKWLTLNIPFSNINYTVIATLSLGQTDTSPAGGFTQVGQKNTTSFFFRTAVGGSQGLQLFSDPAHWYACGY